MLSLKWKTDNSQNHGFFFLLKAGVFSKTW
jgi:hypothetical protein